LTFVFYLGILNLMPRPWNKITIPKSELRNLYENQGLSIAQIASRLGYSSSPIHRLLREYRSKIRTISQAKEKFKISKKELRNLYWSQKLSTNQIAQKYNCNHTTIVYRMKKYGIKSRGHLGLTRPIRVSKENLEYLYRTRGLSLDKIARILHCSEGGLQRKMRDFEIKSRPISSRACKYKKKDFSGSLTEKAYMIGFRLGDLNVSKGKSVISVRCSTTKRAQASLIKNLFSPYGGVATTKAKRGTIEINVFLNNSFLFLMPKEDKIPDWVTKNDKYFLALFAGYSDAEGSLYLHRMKKRRLKFFARFELNSYDKNILKRLWSGFRKFGIKASFPSVSHPAGTPCGVKTYVSNKDTWRLAVSHKSSLWKLIHFWERYSRHKDKQRAIRLAKRNIILRNQMSYCHRIDLSIPKIP